jgi:hypothetical protein
MHRRLRSQLTYANVVATIASSACRFSVDAGA